MRAKGKSITINYYSISYCVETKTFSEACVQVGNTEIKSSFYVKLYVLGVYFDQKIIFDYHVDKLCRKARRKVSVLARLTKTLDVQSKILLFHIL